MTAVADVGNNGFDTEGDAVLDAITVVFSSLNADGTKLGGGAGEPYNSDKKIDAARVTSSSNVAESTMARK